MGKGEAHLEEGMRVEEREVACKEGGEVNLGYRLGERRAGETEEEDREVGTEEEKADGEREEREKVDRL